LQPAFSEARPSGRGKAGIAFPSGEVVGRVQAGGARRYYLKDHLGSIRAVLDGSGNAAERRGYYPFGLPMPGRYEKGSPPTKEDYTGHVKDEATGLHYAGARYYSSAFGRWLGPDPILGQKGPKALLKQDARLLTMTSYNYAFANPLRLRDPTGLAPLDWYRDEEGNIVHDEDVQSQADLKEGQTYLGENALDKRGDGPVQLLTEEGDRVNVFDEAASKGEAGAKGAAGASVPAAAQEALLGEVKKGGKALSRLKGATKTFARGATGVSFGLSSVSEIRESDTFGAYEAVKLSTDAGLAAGSAFGGVFGAGASFAFEVFGGKDAFVREVTLLILESKVDHVAK